mgnify:CR=1 FL=1
MTDHTDHRVEAKAGQTAQAPAEVLTRVGASKARRLFGVAMLAFLGAILLYIGLGGGSEMGFGWRVYMIAMGAAGLWVARGMQRATLGAIVLSGEAVLFEDGAGGQEVITPIAQIISVERGTFANKPSHGFSLRLKAAQARRWKPGLWWRLGKRVGVGGVAAGAETKAMADMIAALITQRAAAGGGAGDA